MFFTKISMVALWASIAFNLGYQHVSRIVDLEQVEAAR